MDEFLEVYLTCGGPEPSAMPDMDGLIEGEGVRGGLAWSRPARFSIRILKADHELAKECVARGGDRCVAAEEGDVEGGPAEEDFHVFRDGADDWGFEMVRFDQLTPGSFADADMNIVFLVTISLQGDAVMA